MANQPPVRVETLWLHGQDKPQPQQQENVWRSWHPGWVSYSPSGRYLAVASSVRLCELRSESGSEGDAGPYTGPHGSECRFCLHETNAHEVHVYHTSEGCKQLASFCTGGLSSDLLWSPADHLCFAQVRRLQHEEPWSYHAAGPGVCEPSAALIWDPSTMTVLHSLCNEAAAVLRELLPACPKWSIWSPSGRYLLIHGAEYHNQTSGKGWMVIADVTKGCLVAHCGLAVASRLDRSQDIVWHPGSQGLIFHSSIHVQDLDSLAHAGFATGFLPADLCMHVAGFSGSAAHFVASHHRPHWLQHADLWVISCTVIEDSICFEFAQALSAHETSEEEAELQVMGWLPDSSTLLMHEYRLQSRASRPLHTRLGAAPVPGKPHKLMLKSRPVCAVSPSGKLSVIQGFLRIASAESGRPCWDALASGPWWSDQQEVELHDVLQEMGRSLKVQAWLPTGLGFICSTDGHVGWHETNMRSALHVYSFA